MADGGEGNISRLLGPNVGRGSIFRPMSLRRILGYIALWCGPQDTPGHRQGRSQGGIPEVLLVQENRRARDVGFLFSEAPCGTWYKAGAAQQQSNKDAQ